MSQRPTLMSVQLYSKRHILQELLKQQLLKHYTPSKIYQHC